MTSGHRTCVCGAVYRRTESLSATREVDSFACAVCGAIMESWNTAWVPAYRLVAGPVKKPEPN
jgi:stage III sporulation protein SpoIIIAA